MSTEGFWDIQEQYHARHSGIWPLEPNTDFITNNYGWFGGGTPPQTSTIDRLDFAAQTVSVSPAKLSTARFGLAATGST